MVEVHVQQGRSPPKPDAEISPEQRKALDAQRRAMPVQRLLDNGMDYADAAALHALATQGVPWPEAASWLGAENLARAEAAFAAGRRITARAAYRLACACFRFAQSPLIRDDARKRAIYRRLIDAYAAAAALDEPPTRKLELAYRGGVLCGWLLRPSDVARPPVVIVIGGADGWREAYDTGARHLVERGVAVLLLDGPGQGETRLFHGLMLTADYTHAYAAVVDALLADASLGDKVGIWGNSMGGHLAAGVAAADPRIAACCATGGTIRPLEILDRFPRFVERFAAMIGTAEDAVALALMRGLDLSEDARRIRCPLLVLHGAPDQVFLLENARRVYELAASADKALMVWDDGDHCLYNHAHEKHGLVADWFRERLEEGPRTRV
jgi:dipeptidyl aminopeptidase/acylaminoacyl peptidase